MFGCGSRGLPMIINSRSEGGRHINLDRGLTNTSQWSFKRMFAKISRSQRWPY